MNNDCDRNLLLVAIRQKERIGRANIPVLSLSCYSRDSELSIDMPLLRSGESRPGEDLYRARYSLS